jgi:hypothetical protein
MATLPFPPNEVRWPRDRKGHYESFWVKANAPDRRLGLWIKHNLLAPRGSDAPPFGEVWAVLFDGEQGIHSVAKQVVPSHEIDLTPTDGILRLGSTVLTEGSSSGDIPANEPLLDAAWSLDLVGSEPPIIHYPNAWMYTAAFPKKKVVTPRPFITLHGTLRVGEVEVDVEDWTGLQGHNWGRSHAFDYAYGNANRFQERDDARFDGFTARIQMGPLTTPRLTGCVLRLGSTDYAFNSKRKVIGGGHYTFPRWSFQIEGSGGYRLSGHVEAARSEFAGLCYADPAGSLADCLNTKFGRGELSLERKVVGRWEEVQRLTGDAFELEFLFRDVDHGVPVVGGDPFEAIP